MKSRIGSLEEEGKVLTCKQAEFWPPSEVRAYGSVQRARKKVTEQRYEQLRTWERVCGLSQMDRSKCLSCPNLVIDGKPVTVPGVKTPHPPNVRLSTGRK